MTIFIFLICMNVLCFLFIPKALMMRTQHGATNRESITKGSNTKGSNTKGLKCTNFAKNFGDCKLKANDFLEKVEDLPSDKIPLLDEFLSTLIEIDGDQQQMLMQSIKNMKTSTNNK